MRLDVRLGLVLAACAAFAFANTRASVHIPPSGMILSAVAVLTTAALLAPDRVRHVAAIAGALLAGLAASHVLLRPGMPQVHDPDHVWGLWAYARALHAGSVLPMWIPDLGAGMPLLQFYGPVSFLLALPAILAGAAPVALWKEAMAHDAVLSAVATLLAARLVGASWRGALIAAFALSFAPWRLAVFHFRGALGEATAFVFAPLVAAGALRLARGPSRAAAWTLAVSMGLLIPTHLITLFCLGIVLVPAVLADRIAFRGGAAGSAPFVGRLVGLAVPSLLAAGVVAAWWVPAIAEGKHTSLPLQTETHRYFIYEEHGLFASDLLTRREWDTSRPSLKRSDRAAGMEGKQMPFYIGAVLFGTAATAPFWSRSRRTVGPACGSLAALILASAPCADVMTHLPLIHTIQFPWRFLSAGSTLAALATGLGACALFEGSDAWKRALPALALPAMLLADAAPYTGAAGWVAPYRGVTHWYLAPGHSLEEPFDVAMRPARQDWSRQSGLVRVAELYLPPDDTTTPIALFWIPYREWTTPALYRGLLAARNPREFGEGSVSWYFLPKREQPVAIPPKPYATLETRDGGVADAGSFERAPGHIALRTTAPAGGARLVVREQAFTGWIATVDGRGVTIGTTPLGFMTIDLTAGTHAVVLDFTRRTPARRAGLAISGLTILGGTFCFFLKSFRRRSSSRKSRMSC